MQFLSAHAYAVNRGRNPAEQPLQMLEVPASSNWRDALLQHGAVIVRGFSGKIKEK
jgi:hypothetical protein